MFGLVRYAILCNGPLPKSVPWQVWQVKSVASLRVWNLDTRLLCMCLGFTAYKSWLTWSWNLENGKKAKSLEINVSSGSFVFSVMNKASGLIACFATSWNVDVVRRCFQLAMNAYTIESAKSFFCTSGHLATGIIGSWLYYCWPHCI